MAYQVLSRKYRPKQFQEVVGQEHVTRSFQNAIAKDRLGHAYILTGTRGIGKTSVARIFAKSLRCQERLDDGNPCNNCEGCREFENGSSMNVLEIDGASNNSVDDVRELVNNVQTLPTFGKYKVYIIDEVHMLSTSAFNALLKTLEEPPEHTVFLLATTEPHKLLDTVLSRCIRFDFRNASVETLVMHIKKIAETENIKFESDDLITILAQQGSGSFRDTLSLMDQVLSFSDDQVVTEDVISVALGLAKVSAIRDLGEAILLGDAQRSAQILSEMLYENVSLSNITTSLLAFYYSVIENVDTLEKTTLTVQGKAFVNGATIDELFWLFESLSRDLSWALEGISPEKTISIIFQKHARRSEILKGTGLAVSETAKKKELTPEPVKEEPIKEEQIKVEPVIEETQAVVEEVNTPETAPLSETESEPTAEVVEKETVTGSDWPSFEEHLKVELPAIFAELEQGNIIGELERSEDAVYIKYGFTENSKLFYDHLITGEGMQKIEALMKSFFQVERAELSITLLNDEEAQKDNFLSKSEIWEKERLEGIAKREEDLRTHPVIKEAEKLFGKTIDKIKVEE